MSNKPTYHTEPRLAGGAPAYAVVRTGPKGGKRTVEVYDSALAADRIVTALNLRSSSAVTG